MVALLCSLAAAVAYGVADFVGGFGGRRTSAWAVALVALVTASIGTGLATVLLGDHFGWSPNASDLWWGVAAGLGNGLGTSMLYRGLAGGRMGVVAPVAGVGTAAVPVLAGLILGERPSVVAWCGIVLALPAIWLVSRPPRADRRRAVDDCEEPETAGWAWVDGMLAGIGFGFFFVCLDHLGDDAGLLPLSVNGAVGAATIILVATTLSVSGMHADWVPRGRAALIGLFPGLLGATSTITFMVATQHGLLTLSAVVTSLFPAITVLLAAVVLGERVHRGQIVGMALCLATVSLVAVG